jgi:hypothetical protein
MYKTAVNEKIGTITRKQIMQILSDEVCGMGAEVYAELGQTQLTNEVEQFGFSILTDEESDFGDKIGCFYHENNVSKLMDFIDLKEISESEINFDNKSITITFADGEILYVEFV